MTILSPCRPRESWQSEAHGLYRCLSCSYKGTLGPRLRLLTLTLRRLGEVVVGKNSVTTYDIVYNMNGRI